MADLALAIAKPLVSGTLERAQSAIEAETRFRKSTQRDLAFITTEFQLMHDFLGGMTEEKININVVSSLMTQVHDLAYDIEDSVEIFADLEGNKLNWMLLILPPFLQPALPMDEAVDTLDQLKARVKATNKRIDRYMSDSVSNWYKRSTTSKPADTTLNGEKQVDKKVPSKELDMEALTKLIAKEERGELQVISVWTPGSHPAGEASSFKEAYDSSERWGNFKWRAWVKMVHPFNLSVFIKSLLDQLKTNHSRSFIRSFMALINHSTDTEHVHVNHDELLEFKRRVGKGSYFLVLEDVSATKEEWETILNHLPNNKGSHILVLTRHLRNARLCTAPCFQRFSTDQSQCVFLKEGPLIGRMRESDQLRHHLTRARNKGLHVISVWGIPGVGKSALVRSLYNEEIETQQYKRYMWVDVCHPFDLREICRSLLLQFRCDSLEANEDPASVQKRDEDPVGECRALLVEHQSLVVIDNLRSTEDWDNIRNVLSLRKSKSFIIVITNEEMTALHCADGMDLVFNVKPLEARESVDLLLKRQEFATNGLDLVSRTDVQLGEVQVHLIDGMVEMNSERRLFIELISKCGGLPKVIAAVSDYLVEAFNWMDRAEILIPQFINKLETRSEFVCLRGLLDWIHSYIRSCPDFLKPCIFYLSIFLQSPITRRRRLVMRWLAEGYPKDKTIDSAEEFFAKLTELSMIQPAERPIITDNRIVRCQINPFFQEYIISKTNEQNFAKEVWALKGCSSQQSTTRTARHFVVEEGWPRDRTAFERILYQDMADGKLSMSRLRSLTVFGEWKPYFLSERMMVLRVLDLENTYGVKDEDLKEMLELLPRLRFLSLRGCRQIRYLPDSVGDQKHLQTLDVRYTSITTLPSSITKLKKLQYLRAGTTVPPEDPSAPHTTAFKVTSQVGKLTFLHTLGVVNVGSSGGKNILKEIKNLTQLCKLGVFGVNKRNIKEFYSIIGDNSHLESLSVWFNKDDCLDYNTSNIIRVKIEPPKTLQSLKLYRLSNKLPVWIDKEKLCNLRKINLEINVLSEDDIRVIGLLKELFILRLRVTPSGGGKLQFQITDLEEEEQEIPSYGKLKMLDITCGSGSLEVTFGKLAMQNLEVLKAGCCRGSDLKFTRLQHLGKLMEVYVFGSHDDTLKRHLEKELNIHKSKLVTLKNEDQRYSFPF